MKYIFSTWLLAAGISAFAQSIPNLNFGPIKQQILDESKKVDTDSTLLLTSAGLDKFFAFKTAKYFGSAGDLTLYNNYFFGNIADGTFSFGRNFRLDCDETFRTSNILNIGLQAQAEDNFSNIYDKNGFAGQIGVDLKYSRILNGKISHSGGVQNQVFKTNSLTGEKAIMSLQRKITYSKLFAQITKDSSDFMASLAELDPAYRGTLIEKFQKKKKDEYWEAFAETEAKAVEDEKAYGLAQVSWFSIGFHVPLTGKSYLIAPDLNDPFVEREDWLTYAEGNFTYVRDSRRLGLSLFNGSVRIGNYNNIESKELEESTITKYQLLGGKDTLTLSEVGKQSLYVGKIERFNLVTLQTRIIHFFPGDCSWLGLSATYKYEIAQKKTMNLTFGIPLSLNGQDIENDEKVNIELQFRIIDFTNEIPESGKNKLNYQFGINLGIPFGGIDL